MHAACLMRRTYDPRELGSLTVADNRIVADRVQLVKNEGDVRAIQLAKAARIPFQVLSVGGLDDITRVHCFVYGAQEIWELGESPSHDLPETLIARMIAAQIGKLDAIHLVALGCVEQDTGRDTLPGLVAAALGWELFSNVLSLRVDDQRAVLTQVTDAGTQEIDVALPICLSADESCALGRDPSDEYDLIEKLEKRPSRKVSIAELGIAAAEAPRPELSSPPERQAQPVVAAGPDAVTRVAEMIRRFQAA
jgi:electron transfer flavoprotein alpha/beta subunit